jgi:hypothetical protein
MMRTKYLKEEEIWPKHDERDDGTKITHNLTVQCMPKPIRSTDAITHKTHESVKDIRIEIETNNTINRPKLMEICPKHDEAR